MCPHLTAALRQDGKACGLLRPAAWPTRPIRRACARGRPSGGRRAPRRRDPADPPRPSCRPPTAARARASCMAIAMGRSFGSVRRCGKKRSAERGEEGDERGADTTMAGRLRSSHHRPRFPHLNAWAIFTLAFSFTSSSTSPSTGEVPETTGAPLSLSSLALLASPPPNTAFGVPLVPPSCIPTLGRLLAGPVPAVAVPGGRWEGKGGAGAWGGVGGGGGGAVDGDSAPRMTLASCCVRGETGSDAHECWLPEGLAGAPSVGWGWLSTAAWMWHRREKGGRAMAGRGDDIWEAYSERRVSLGSLRLSSLSAPTLSLGSSSTVGPCTKQEHGGEWERGTRAARVPRILASTRQARATQQCLPRSPLSAAPGAGSATRTPAPFPPPPRRRPKGPSPPRQACLARPARPGVWSWGTGGRPLLEGRRSRSGAPLARP